MRVLLPAALTAILVAPAFPQQPSDQRIEEIITKFAAKEAEFALARENYTYRQTVRIQEIDPAGNAGGKFEVVSDIIFSAEGKRTERVVRAPVPTLRNITMTPEDEQDLRNVQPFVLTTKELPNYHIRYLGKQTLDEIPCFTFAVKPKKMEPGQRYFSGIVWVDDRDLQIVKTYGRGTGLTKKGFDNQFPKFETYREQIDGKFWFPTYTAADTILPFESGPQRIKLMVRYQDYKQFGSDIKITFGDEVTGTGSEKAAPPETKPATPAKKP